jgi:hypothetical protein
MRICFIRFRVSFDDWSGSDVCGYPEGVCSICEGPQESFRVDSSTVVMESGNVFGSFGYSIFSEQSQ